MSCTVWESVGLVKMRAAVVVAISFSLLFYALVFSGILILVQVVKLLFICA